MAPVYILKTIVSVISGAKEEADAQDFEVLGVSNEGHPRRIVAAVNYSITSSVSGPGDNWFCRSTATGQLKA